MKARVYLGGAIEKSPDQGKTWRENITPFLEKIGLEVFNPCDQDILLWKKYGFDVNEYNEIFLPKHRVKFETLMREIVEKDLIQVLRSKILLVYYDKYVGKGAGTLGEITLASHSNKCVILMLAPSFPKEKLPGWIIGCAHVILNAGDQKGL